ncbi:MAG: hypothetical protein ABI623_04935, partial [bacterium]
SRDVIVNSLFMRFLMDVFYLWRITFRGYTQCGIITTKLQYVAQMFNFAQNCHTKHCAPVLSCSPC